MLEKKGTILSCMRPTGRLHLGHYSVLENWVALQEKYQCYYAVELFFQYHEVILLYKLSLHLPQNV